MIHELHFQRESIIDINAAVVGISRNRWTAARPGDNSTEYAQKTMKANRFDVLPIDDGGRVREYFNTQEWGVYAEIERKAINHRDVISYQATIRDVIKGFATENRYFYFLGSENRIVGLVTIGNLNCKQAQTYLFSLFCELETAIASYLSSVMSQKEIEEKFTDMTTDPKRIRGVKKRYKADKRKGVDALFVEYLYFSDLINLIDAKRLAHLGISAERQNDMKKLKDWRNKAAHPTQSLIREPEKVRGLWGTIDMVEEVIFQLRHNLDGEL